MPRERRHDTKGARGQAVAGLHDFRFMQLAVWGTNPTFKLTDPGIWIDDPGELRVLWRRWQNPVTIRFNDPRIDGSRSGNITGLDGPWFVGVCLPPYMQMEHFSRHLDELPDDGVIPLPAEEVPLWARTPGRLSDTIDYGSAAFHVSRMLSFFPEACARHPVTRRLWAALRAT